MCPTDHPFIPVAALEAEGSKLLEGVITILFTSQYVMGICVHNACKGLITHQESRHCLCHPQQLVHVGKATSGAC